MRVGAIFASLLFAFAHAEIPVEDNVLVLSESNFDEAVAAHSQLLVEFYAPWCGHCKSLAPEWAKAAKTLADSPVKLAKVDATENNKLAEQFGVRGFPTIKYLKNGKPSDYSGGRVESEIVSWVNKKSGPAATTISSEEELLKFQEKHEVFALGAFSSSTSEAATAFLAFSGDDELHTFAITTDAAVIAHLGLSEDSVVVLKTFDDKRADLSVAAGFDAETVGEFINGNSVPLVQTFSPESSKKIFSNPITKHFLFFTDKAAAHHEPTIAAYTAAASAFKGKVLFVNVPHTENKVLEFFGLTAAQVPTAVLADLGGDGGQIKKFPFTEEASLESVSAFVEEFLSGKMKPVLKSEAVEAADTTGPVVVLRGTSFSDLVINNDHDVLVEFYAPWCGHCKKLAPTWDELGAKVKKTTDKVVIAKMDATANEVDVPGLAVKGFPSIYFFKGNDKAHPQKYDGARELDNFLEFLAENAHNGFEHEEL